MTTYYTYHACPLGELLLTSNGTALTRLYLPTGKSSTEPEAGWARDDDSAPFALARAELDDYFAARLRRFTVPLAGDGTAFQRRVWQALCEIPYGRTEGYGELAARIGAPGGARAVGLANGRNPIAIIVPCHRVIGADGRLVGYGGGMRVKERLLALEGARQHAAGQGVLAI
jgi:methylated-DNA-[protein]-cysteine S-methyltransferase